MSAATLPILRGACRTPARPPSPFTGAPPSSRTAGLPIGDWSPTSRTISPFRCSAAATASSRAVLRNPWILAQAADMTAGRRPRAVTLHDRGRFLLDYIDLLLREGVNECEGFRHVA